jgi:transposase
MLIPVPDLRVYIATGSTDMRKAINGLSILVERRMELDPFSGHLFVFSNKRRNLIKVLYWDHNGFCLWQKRLERDRFRWPEGAEEVMRISPRELRWLLDGLEVVQGRAHRQVRYSSVT